MSSDVEEIKTRLDIVDLVSEYITMKQAGTNWMALCPFHNEKSPSFMVSRDKQIFHCFGCGEGGDIFAFVQKMEGIDFPEALKLLAQKAGIKLTVRDPKLASQKNRLLDITKIAAEFWHRILLESPHGQKGRQYLQQRKVSDNSIMDFKLGYAPQSWDTTIKFLLNKGFKDNEIFLSGLSIKKERGAGFYDRFRDRLMFPINDIHGNPIGFTGRALNPDEKGGKYINTPQTLIYNKSNVIFNLDKAKMEIKRLNYAVMVEGQMDVISTYVAGTKNVIATSGTALTEEQVGILKRYTDNLAIAFDTDAAGLNAAKRGIEIALGLEMNVKVIVVPGGKDPDEAVKTNPELWFNAVKNAKSIIQFYFDETLKDLDLANVEHKKRAAKALLPVISKISNTIERTHWLQQLSEKINVPADILGNEILSGDNKKRMKSHSAPETGKNEVNRFAILSNHVVGIILKYPKFAHFAFENLPADMLNGSDVSALYKNLSIYYIEQVKEATNPFNFQSFVESIRPKNLDVVADRLVLLVEKDFFDFTEQMLQQELEQSIHFLKKNYYTSQLQEIEARLRQAEQQNNTADIQSLSAEFNKIIAQLNSL